MEIYHNKFMADVLFAKFLKTLIILNRLHKQNQEILRVQTPILQPSSHKKVVSLTTFFTFLQDLKEQPYPQTMFTFWEMFASLAPFPTFREMLASLAPFFNFREMFASLAPFLTSLAPFCTAAVVIVLSPFVKEHIPSAVSNYLVSTYENWLSKFSTPQVTVVIEETSNFNISNQIYEAARLKLRTLISDSTKPKRFKVNKKDGQNESTIDIVEDEEVTEEFKGIRLKWKLCADGRYFELSFNKGFEKEVLESYLPDMVGCYERFQKENNVVKLYGSRDSRHYHEERWVHVILEHPVTFDKLAMDPKEKEMLKADLDRFLGRKDLYDNAGKTWKRGYLLHGPPGTGKSSLIAAMANYVKFNIYELSLSGRHTDESLRSILLLTTNRSILVIEDIDCSAELDECRREYDSFTLSGLLNIIDGLWSSCGEERIIVFTTNDKDKLDPALLRPGRMDVHVHMSYCTMDGFKVLASNYLKIEGYHQLYGEIEDLLKNVEVTPAEIAEELLKKGDPDEVSTKINPNEALQGVVEFLKQRKTEKANAAGLKESLKSADIDVDAEGLVKFLEQKKLEKAKAKVAERLLRSADIDVEELAKFWKQKKIEDAKAAEAKLKNPKES